MKTTYAALKNAREIVKTRWQKKASGAKGEPRCALGAVSEACYGLGNTFNYDAYNGAVMALRAVVREDERSGGGFVSAFNDHAETTQQDVVDVFTKAMRAKR